MRNFIPGREIVACLSRRGPVHHCERCGERMYVPQRSGLCPHCWNSRSPAAAAALIGAAACAHVPHSDLDLELELMPEDLCLDGILEESLGLDG